MTLRAQARKPTATDSVGNLHLEEVEYKIVQTRRGAWRRYVYPDGTYFAEYKTYATWMGLPVVHYTHGRCPDTGKRIIARGVVAVGRLAVGLVAVGQASLGIVAIGQLGIGLLFGLAQLGTGVIAVGQFAFGLAAGLGQVATGYVAIGQFGIGYYVLAQAGFGAHLWSQGASDPAAVEFFKSLGKKFLFGGG